MTAAHRAAPRIAIVYPGDAQARRDARAGDSRFAAVFDALVARGAQAEPAVYQDALAGEVRTQLLRVDAALVWVNPVEGGRDRTVLDALLHEVSAAGVFVSAHPDVILAMGTKEVLYRTRDVGWGCDTHLYPTLDSLRDALPGRLADGGVRVLKQYRGNGGSGVWKVTWADVPRARASGAARVRVRHALRGSVEQTLSLAAFLARCEPYFADGGRMVDQAYQPRLPEGMTRCYLVHDTVAGFGHQAINALHPAPPGAPADQAPEPGPRVYHPADQPEFQTLKVKVERDWVPAMQRTLGIDTAALPVIWDCDFLLGAKSASGEDTHVLCEINVSSVAPFPDSAVAPIADAVCARARAARESKR